ncbi:hypothetical protein LPJ56_001994 [Coemansia sp. RSA 2599]|nr:hypothetical protein LPJ75_001624 [Coemansia sp. RSA 2598]KAJ1826808.1 hypothetical protein LPJ56_001994 [Coemansia sp. RSA 2599]
MQADPEYFSTASLVLSSRRGEANLDGLAQLARLLLRYFEQGLGRQLSRDSIPGVDSLCVEPFDDFWRLVVLVVSATLLSDRNGASDIYDALDGGLQKVLRSGMDDTWGETRDDVQRTHMADLGSSEVSRLTGSGGIRLMGSEAQNGVMGGDGEGGSHGGYRRSSPVAGPPLMHSHVNSSDSVASGRSSFQQQFHSAYSSISAHNVADRAEQHEQSVLSSRHEPALLDVVESQDKNDLESIASIASTDVYRDEYGDEYSEQGRGSMAGFEVRRSQQLGLPTTPSSEGDTDSLADSYVSEFSQDLLQYGADPVPLGFSGPSSLFAYLFVANTIAYAATGLYLIVTTQVPKRKSPYFKDFNDTIWAIMQITAASVVAVALSVVWMQLLRYQTRKVIWLTTLGIPVVSTATAVWVGTQILSIPGSENLVGYRVRSALVILVAVILAVRFIWSISRRRHEIERSVRVVSLACDVLALNKELYAFSLLLLAIYGAYAALSAIIASRLPLVQSLVTMAGGWPAERLGLATYLSVSFAWTSAVFVQLLRIIVSSVVCQWYFHRHDPGEPPALQTLQAATLSAITRQFGTVVLSATLLFIAKLLHLVELVLRWIIGLLRVIPVSLVSLVVGRPVYLADGWSSYTAVYSAFTGKGFFQASRTIVRLLRTHGLLHSPVVSLIRSSMTCYALLLSLVFGYSLGLRAIHLVSLHSALVAVAGSIMPFALLQLVTHVLTCTVEALVVCYAIDLELDSCHSVDVAEAMAAV